MSLGNMMGGAFQGGMAVWNQFQQDDRLKLDQERMQIERDKAAREKTAFDQAEAVKKKLGDSLAEEESANRSTSLADTYTTAAKTDPSLLNGAGMVAPGPDAPAASGNVATDSIALGTANINADQTLSDTDKAAQIQAMTQGVKAAWTPKYGLVPDVVNAYRFQLERANILTKSGALKEGREMKASAQDDAAGAGMSALLSGDHRTFNVLKSIFDRGRKSPDVQGFDAKGNLIVGFDSVNKPITHDKYDALMAIGATASSPEKTMQMFTSRANREDMDELKRLLGLRAADTRDASVASQIDRRLVQNATDGAKITGGTGGAGTRTGTGTRAAGGGAAPEYWGGSLGLKDQATTDAFINENIGKVAEMNAQAGVPVDKSKPLDNVTTRLNTGTMLGQIIQANPGRYGSAADALRDAHRLAALKEAGGSAWKPMPEIDLNDGQWYLNAHSKDGKPIRLSKTHLSADEVARSGVPPEEIMRHEDNSARLQLVHWDKLNASPALKKGFLATHAMNEGQFQQEYATAKARAEAGAERDVQRAEYSREGRRQPTAFPRSRANVGNAPPAAEARVVEGIAIQPTGGERLKEAWNSVTGALSGFRKSGHEQTLDVALKRIAESSSLSEHDASNIALISERFPELQGGIPANVKAAVSAATGFKFQ